MATTTMHQPHPMLVPDIVPMSPPDSSTNGHIYHAQDGDKGSVRVKRISKSKGLQRSDSDKSNKSHTSLGAMSFMNYDPQNEGSLARDAEITLSMYDVYDDTAAVESHVNGGVEVQKQHRRSSSGQTPVFSSGRRISQTSQASVKSWSSGNVGAVGVNTASPVQEEKTTTTVMTSTTMQQNGRHSPEEQVVSVNPGENLDLTSSVRTSTHIEETQNSVDMMSNGSAEARQVESLMSSAQESHRDVLSGAEGGSSVEVQLLSPPQGFEDERHTSPSITPLQSTSAASTLAREVKSGSSKAVSKVGTFTMKPASNLTEETPVTLTSASSQFKSSLEDTMKRIVKERNGTSSGEASRERSKASTPALSRTSSVSKHTIGMALATDRCEEIKTEVLKTQEFAKQDDFDSTNEVIDNQEVADDILSIADVLKNNIEAVPNGNLEENNKESTSQHNQDETSVHVEDSGPGTGYQTYTAPDTTIPGIVQKAPSNASSHRASKASSRASSHTPSRASSHPPSRQGSAANSRRASTASTSSSVTLTRSLSSASDLSSTGANYDLTTSDHEEEVITGPLNVPKTEEEIAAGIPFERDIIPGGSMKRSLSHASSKSSIISKASSESSRSGQRKTSVDAAGVMKAGSQTSLTSNQSRTSGLRMLPKSPIETGTEATIDREKQERSHRSSITSIRSTHSNASHTSNRMKPKEQSGSTTPSAGSTTPTAGSTTLTPASTLERSSTSGPSISRSSSKASHSSVPMLQATLASTASTMEQSTSSGPSISRSSSKSSFPIVRSSTNNSSSTTGKRMSRSSSQTSNRSMQMRQHTDTSDASAMERSTTTGPSISRSSSKTSRSSMQISQPTDTSNTSSMERSTTSGTQISRSSSQLSHTRMQKDVSGGPSPWAFLNQGNENDNHRISTTSSQLSQEIMQVATPNIGSAASTPASTMDRRSSKISRHSSQTNLQGAPTTSGIATPTPGTLEPNSEIMSHSSNQDTERNEQRVISAAGSNISTPMSTLERNNASSSASSLRSYTFEHVAPPGVNEQQHSSKDEILTATLPSVDISRSSSQKSKSGLSIPKKVPYWGSQTSLQRSASQKSNASSMLSFSVAAKPTETDSSRAAEVTRSNSQASTHSHASGSKAANNPDLSDTLAQVKQVENQPSTKSPALSRTSSAASRRGIAELTLIQNKTEAHEVTQRVQEAQQPSLSRSSSTGSRAKLSLPSAEHQQGVEGNSDIPKDSNTSTLQFSDNTQQIASKSSRGKPAAEASISRSSSSSTSRTLSSVNLSEGFESVSTTSTLRSATLNNPDDEDEGSRVTSRRESISKQEQETPITMKDRVPEAEQVTLISTTSIHESSASSSKQGETGDVKITHEPASPPQPGAFTYSSKSESSDHDQNANTDQHSIMKDNKFKAEVSKLYGGGDQQSEATSPSWAQKTSSNIAKSKFREYDFNFDPSVGGVYTGHDDRSNELQDIFAARRKQNKSLEDDDTSEEVTPGQVEVVSNRPLSPKIEIKETVKSGTVAKLAKDFKDVPLTGRIADVSTLEKSKEKTKAPDEGEEKKFKFLVEGIDVPVKEGVDEGGENEVSPTVPLPPLSPHSPTSHGEGEEELEGDTLTRKKKGFTYLLDQALAAEVRKRAEDVTSRKPHEALELERAHQSEATHANEEVVTLREARARLHKQLTQRRDAELAQQRASLPPITLKETGRLAAEKESRPTSQEVKHQINLSKISHETDGERVSEAPVSPVSPPPPPPPLPPTSPLAMPGVSKKNKEAARKTKVTAKTSATSSNATTSKQQQKQDVKETTAKVRETSEGGPLSPDSAYQSDASPGLDIRPLLKDSSRLQPAMTEVLAAHGAMAPPQGHQVFEAKQKFVQELKTSTKTIGPPTKESNGRAEVKETSQASKMAYEASYRGGTDVHGTSAGASTSTGASTSMGAVSGSNTTSTARLTQHGEANILDHQIHMDGSNRMTNGLQSEEGGTGVHIMTGGETTSLRSVSDASDMHSTRSAPAHGGLSIHTGTETHGSTLRSTAHLSTSTQDNAYNSNSSTLNSHGKKTAKVIPLKPLTIDVSHSQYGSNNQLKTHPSGVSPGPGVGVTSPTVKHVQGMFEMAEMTGGSYQQQSNYDANYMAYRTEAAHHGPRPTNNIDHGNLGLSISGDLNGGYDMSRSYSGDYPRGKSMTSYDTMESRYSSVFNRTSDDVFMSDTGTFGRGGRGARYLRVDESRGGRVPMYGDRDYVARDLEGYQYDQSRRHHGRHVARVLLDGDPADWDAQSLYSDTYEDDRGHRGRYRHRRKHSANRRANVRRSRSQPGINRIAQPIHFNIQTQNLTSLDSAVRPGQYNTWRSAGVEDPSATLRSNTYDSLHSANYQTMTSAPATSPTPADMDPSLDDVRGHTGNYHITLKLRDPGLANAGTSTMQRGLEHSSSFHSSHGRSTRQSNYTSSVSVPDYEVDSLRDEVDHPGIGNITTVRTEGPPSGRFLGVGRTGEEQHFNIDIRDMRPPGGDYYTAHTSTTQYAHMRPSAAASLSPSHAPPPRADGPPPAFAMAVNQTLTMDYQPKDKEYPPPMASVPRARRPRRPSSEEGLPRVKRGTILIQNRIDTTGQPVVRDLVVQGESDDEEEFVVEDNTNLFHSKYFQSRENPLFSSNEDLREVGVERPRKPAFTEIFTQEHTEIPVNYRNGDDTPIRVERREPLLARPKGHDEPDEGGLYEEGFDETTIHTTTTREYERPRVTKTTTTEQDIARFLRNAPPGSVKQSINVEREEEDIIGPLPMKHADGTATGPEGLLNFDTVSEKVDIGVLEGVAQLAVKVRCERIVPIRGVEDMFKKSSVIVTRLIEIDLEATEERKRLYENIMHGGSSQAMIEDGSQGHRTHTSRSKLSTKDTFKLYKTFMGIAEAEDGKGMGGRTMMEKRIEDQRAPPRDDGFTYGAKERERMQYQLDKDEEREIEEETSRIFGGDNLDGEHEGFDTAELDRRQEAKIHADEDRVVLEEIGLGDGSKLKIPEPDAVSFMSHATEGTPDIIF